MGFDKPTAPGRTMIGARGFSSPRWTNGRFRESGYDRLERWPDLDVGVKTKWSEEGETLVSSEMGVDMRVLSQKEVISWKLAK